MFDKLKEFRAVNGHFAVPRRSREQRRLVDWAVNQRILRRTRLLSPAHERALDEIGFDWDPTANRWEEMFQQLIEFKKEHGHNERTAAFRKLQPACSLGAKPAGRQTIQATNHRGTREATR